MGECGLNQKARASVCIECVPPIQDQMISNKKGKYATLFFSLSDLIGSSSVSLVLLGEMLEARSRVTLGRDTRNGVDLVLASVLLRGLLPCLGLCDRVLSTYFSMACTPNPHGKRGKEKTEKEGRGKEKRNRKEEQKWSITYIFFRYLSMRDCRGHSLVSVSLFLRPCISPKFIRISKYGMCTQVNLGVKQPKKTQWLLYVYVCVCNSHSHR